MERWARERPRRQPGQPSFSSTLLDAICDAMDEQPAGAAAAKEQQDAAALHCYCYYYKPSLAASHHRAARLAEDDCHGRRGYFSSSELEYSLRPIRTSSRAAAAAPHAEKQPQATGKARKPATGSARVRPASPGARLAGLLNAIFTGKRHSARQHPAPPDDEPAAAPSTTRPCFARKPSARASRSRSRTVRFLDMDGEVAVAAAAAGCRHIPVVEVEVEELTFRPAESDVGEGSSDASSDLFELESLAAVDPAGGGGGQERRACGDELPVYGTTAVGLRGGVRSGSSFGIRRLRR